MQIMPYTGKDLAPIVGIKWAGHSFKPSHNVRMGTRYLALLIKKYGNVAYALTSYNRGPRATSYILDKYGKLPKKVRAFYSDKVLRHYDELKRKGL